MPKSILCYGDSNTWGYIPGIGERFDRKSRWPGICQMLLGDDYEIIEAGLSGRTTIFDDPKNRYFNGFDGLGYALLSAKPLDLVIVSLGTNDLKFCNLQEMSSGIDAIIGFLLNHRQITVGSSSIFKNEAKILLISPIALSERVPDIPPYNAFMGKELESRRVSAVYEAVAQKYGVDYLDASQFAEASSKDGVHMDCENHHKFAKAVAQKVKQLLE